MQRNITIRRSGWLSLLIAAFLALGVSARSMATVIPLGTVSSATTLNFGNSGLSDPFSDSYLFTIAAGNTLDFSSLVTTGFVRIYGINDFAGSLYGDSGLIANGIASTRYLPEGFPAFDVSFASVLLGAGDYTLQLTGNPYSSRGAGAAYTGVANFADVTSAVPEPGTLALMGLALAGLGISRYRRPAS